MCNAVREKDISRVDFSESLVGTLLSQSDPFIVLGKTRVTDSNNLSFVLFSVNVFILIGMKSLYFCCLSIISSFYAHVSITKLSLIKI